MFLSASTNTVDELLSVFQSTKYLGGTRNCAAQQVVRFCVPLFLNHLVCVLRWNESHFNDFIAGIKVSFCSLGEQKVLCKFINRNLMYFLFLSTSIFDA